AATPSRSRTAIAMPSRASRRAIARPIPPPAPVTSAVLPLRPSAIRNSPQRYSRHLGEVCHIARRLYGVIELLPRLRRHLLPQYPFPVVQANLREEVVATADAERLETIRGCGKRFLSPGWRRSSVSEPWAGSGRCLRRRKACRLIVPHWRRGSV